jgi:hypothetical protein
MHPDKTNVAKDRAYWTKVMLRRSANAVSLRRQQTVLRERIKRNAPVSHPAQFRNRIRQSFLASSCDISVIYPICSIASIGGAFRNFLIN